MSNESISFPVRCSHCQAEMDSPIVCEACHSLQPVGGQVDAYDLLQLPLTYHIDADQLEDVYLRLTRMVHPDYFGGGRDKPLSEDLSARINNAYRTLKDPLQRSEYLLARAGGKSATDDKRVPPAMLGQVLEVREQVEQARQGGPAGQARLRELHGELAEQADAAFDQLGELHRRLESAQAAADEARLAELLEQVRLQLNGVRYLRTLLRETDV